MTIKTNKNSLRYLFVLILVLVISRVLVDATSTKVKCIESEREALLDFKEPFIKQKYYSESSRILDFWDTDYEEDCCKWQGIKCSKVTGHITTLNLNGQQLSTGEVSPSLLHLKHLTHLDLGDNYLNSNIPKFFGSFSKLQYLNLSSMNLYDSIPHQLKNLTNLIHLDLSCNYFQHIPSFFGSLSKLQYLNLANSMLTQIFRYHPVGPIPQPHAPVPQQLGNLTNLRFLDLGMDDSGTLSVENLEWLSSLHLLRYLSLSGINLNRTNWLQTISQLSFLTELYLKDCNLPGDSSLSLPLTNSSSIPPLSVIDLTGNLFNSSMSYDWLVNLSTSGRLVELWMANNPLGGPLPEAIGSLVSLEILDLGECDIQGEIPKSFGNLRHLRILYLYSNEISGQFPAIFQAFTSLEYLNIYENSLTGSLPDFSMFPSLKVLLLGYNNLDGSFPESFSRISGLNVLDLSGNQMTGPLPELEFLPSLRELWLRGNKLNGTIPRSLGKLSKLEIFEVYLNSFEGPISEAHLSNLSKLTLLDLSWCSLSFEVNSNWTPPFQLDVIKLSSCKLGTHFPNWLQSQNNFSVLDISGAKISDTVPSWFWDLSKKVTCLNISNNQLSGTIPSLSSKVLDNLKYLDLSSNRFNGPIPVLPSTLRGISLSKNMLTGSVSSLSKTPMMFVDISDNLLSGELPDFWESTNTWGYGLTLLNLANNNLSGEIPSSIGNLTDLFALQLRNNSFIGELPLSLQNCTSLKVIDLSLNKLSGKVPAWVGMSFSHLFVLSLRRNEFNGAIPPEICQSNRLRILDLSQNNISGDIPSCFNNFSSMVDRIAWTYDDEEFSYGAGVRFAIKPDDAGIFIGNALVEWKRQESEYKKTLGLLRGIDLSSNKLVGNIPLELANLRKLIFLNLSRNSLTGNIIKKIGEMTMLESIDFSNNHLSGEIPNSLSNLSFLSVLDLSNNNLSGRIPTSTQLQSFDASAYAGNRQLCGAPLQTKCSGEEAAPVPPSINNGKGNNNEEDEDKFITTTFYISVTLGFIVGFWGFCGPLLLKNSWRYEYFKKVEKIVDWVYVMAVERKENILMKLR